VRYQLQTQTVE